jgi:2-iminobutanoate/2-iminopropanoate deaminase
MEKKIITSANSPTPIGPYSPGVMIENTLYTSGQVAKDAVTGEMIQHDISAETKKVMELENTRLKLCWTYSRFEKKSEQ